MGTCLIIRGTALLASHSSLTADPDAYARLALNWADTGVYGLDANHPTAFRPPLYPWLLSWLATEGASTISPLATATLSLALGTATVWLTWSVACSLRLRLAWLPALLVCLDPLLLQASTLVMTETLAAFFVVLAWQLWLIAFALTGNSVEPGCHSGLLKHNRPIEQWLALLTLGCVFGLSILARPTAAPWTALCVAGTLVAGAACWKRRINDSLILSLIVIGCLAPWVLRNYAFFGKPIWATTHGGYTLLLANNPQLYDHFRNNGPSRDWDAESFHRDWQQRHSSATSAADEVASDRQDYQLAWSTITSRPDEFLRSCVYRVGWLWAVWPNVASPLMRVAVGWWYTIALATAIPGVYIAVKVAGWRSWYPALAFVLALTAVHAVYWSNMRMRSPAMAIIYVACASLVKQPTRDGRDAHH